MKVTHSNEVAEVLTGERYGKNYRGEVILHNRKIPDQRADFARGMIQAWGIVAGRPAIGMEPQDKREIALMSAKEVVDRACELAALAYEEFGHRGWMLDVPSWDDVNTPEEPTT